MEMPKIKSFVVSALSTAVLLSACCSFAQLPQGRRSLRDMMRNRQNQSGGSAANGSRSSANATQPDSGASADGGNELTADLNFNQTPIDLVLETYSRMVGKTILKDPQTPSATITLKSESGQKLSKEEQIEAIEVILEMNDIHLEPYGEKFIRALPRKDVRKKGIPLMLPVKKR